MNSELMVMSQKRKIILRKKLKIVLSGRSSHLPLGKELKNLFSVGDELDVTCYIEDGKVVIRGIKELCRFNFEDIKILASDNIFKITDDKTIGDVKVFQAVKNSTVISCTQNLNSHEVSIIVYKTTPVTNYALYEKIKQDALRSNAIIQPAGDVDVINILEDPSQYDLDFKNAFSLLKKNGKEIGISVLFKFNNENHILANVKQAVEKLK